MSPFDLARNWDGQHARPQRLRLATVACALLTPQMSVLQAYQWWLADMYLNNPMALPINSNPGMVFPPALARTAEERARFAARMVLSAVRYQEILDK